MNDQLDGEIRALLSRLEDLTPLPPSFDELQGLAQRRIEERPTWQRPLVSFAAATVVVGALAGLLWAVRDRSSDPVPPANTVPSRGTTATTPVSSPPSTSPGGTAPAVPSSDVLELEAFPALDPADPRDQDAQGGYSQIAASNPAQTSALIARRDGDRLTGGIKITARASVDDLGEPTGFATVNGVRVDYVVEPGTPSITTAIVRGNPAVTYTGLDPFGYLTTAGLDPATASTDPDTGVVELELAELASGYQVVVRPEPLAVGSLTAFLHVQTGDTADGAGIEVEVGNPLLGWATAGDLQAVDVNGTQGWITTTPGYAVTWPIGDHTWASVGGNATSETTLELARAVMFVDEATWQQRYDVPEPDFAPPTSYTVPESVEHVDHVQLGLIDIDVTTDEANRVCTSFALGEIHCFVAEDRIDHPLSAASLDPLDGPAALLQVITKPGTRIEPLPTESRTVRVGDEDFVLHLALVDDEVYCGTWHADNGESGSFSVHRLVATDGGETSAAADMCD